MVGVSCSCVYNKNERCKHIAALIYYVNNHRSLSKTSQFVQEKYSKGCSFAVIFPPPKKDQIEPHPIDVSKLIGPSPLKNILLVDDNAHEKRKKQLLEKSQMEAAVKYEKCTKFVKIMLELREIHYTYGRDISADKKLIDFYEKSIVLKSADAIIKLCCDTLQQSESDTWYAARRLRISASTNVHSIKTRKTKSIEALVQEMLYPKKVDTTATRYGKNSESNARKQYELLYGVCVQQFGLVISEDQQWLCASPDGAVIKDDFIEKLVEIKCPYSCVKLPIVDYEAKKCNVSYLELKDDNTVDVKRSSSCFTQCQVQMYVTGTDTCDLFVHSPIENGSCCITVMRDEQFLMDVIPKCEQFYFEHYLPTLYNKMVVEPNKLSQSCAEKQNTPKRTFTGRNVVNII